MLSDLKVSLNADTSPGASLSPGCRVITRKLPGICSSNLGPHKNNQIMFCFKLAYYPGLSILLYLRGKAIIFTSRRGIFSLPAFLVFPFFVDDGGESGVFLSVVGRALGLIVNGGKVVDCPTIIIRMP